MTVEERRKICVGCEHSTNNIPFIGKWLDKYVKIRIWLHCKLCGCSVTLKTMDYNFFKMKCPDKPPRW